MNFSDPEDFLLVDFEYDFEELMEPREKVDTHSSCYHGMHKWKTYTGIYEEWEYCELCDIKKKDYLATRGIHFK